MSLFDFFSFLKSTPNPSPEEERAQQAKERIAKRKSRYRFVIDEIGDLLGRRGSGNQEGLRGFPLDVSLDEADLEPAVNIQNLRREAIRRITRVELLDQRMVVLFTPEGSDQIFAAELMDISPQGMMVISDATFQEGTHLHFFVRVGNKIPNGTNEFMAIAIVRRVDGRKYGLQILRPPKDFQDYIIQLSGAVGLQRPLSGAK